MQLHAAAARGDLEGMVFALARGADVNDCNRDGQTALVFALERARGFSRRCGPLVTPEAVRFLVQAGVDLEARDSLGTTAIHYAAAIPDPALLEIILEFGGQPKHVTKSGYSVLIHACYQPAGSAKRAIVRRLHNAGVALDAITEFGEFPLGVCLRFGDLETLRLLLDLGADPGPLHWTPLHHAVALGTEAELARLAPSALEINAFNRGCQLSPWLLAFFAGDLGKIQWLAEHGADLTQVDRMGQSPTHFAAEFGHVAALRWLLELGADPNALSDSSDSSPLHAAAEWDHVECACTLLALGADTNPMDHGLRQPIHVAKSVPMLQALVERGGADVNAVDSGGDWPLKLAAEANDIARLEWLLSHGAEVDRTSTGETALHTALRDDSREAVDVLLKAGANPNQPDVDGWTPFFLAASREVIHTLRAAGGDPLITDQAGGGPQRWLKDPILIRALKEPL